MAHSEPSQPAPVRKTRQQQNTQNTKNEWMASRYSIHSECHKTFFYISLLWPATYKNDMKRHQRRRIFIYTARSAFCTRWNIGTNTNDKKIWKRQLFLTWIRFFQFFRETSFQRWISWFSSTLCAIHFGIRTWSVLICFQAQEPHEMSQDSAWIWSSLVQFQTLQQAHAHTSSSRANWRQLKQLHALLQRFIYALLSSHL